VIDALPVWSVVDDVADRVPSPLTTPQLTFAFGTGAPVGVVTDTTSGAGRVTSNGPFCPSPEAFITTVVVGVGGGGDTGVLSLPHPKAAAIRPTAITDEGRIIGVLSKPKGRRFVPA
jgi:hypothetical protein